MFGARILAICATLGAALASYGAAGAQPVVAPVAAESAAQSPVADGFDAALRDLFSQPGAPIEPDVFGYQAVAVDVTALDGRWRDAEDPEAKPLTGEWADLVARTRDLPARGKADAINLFVNRHIAVASDQDVYGVADYWASLSETIEAGRGDCEDFAIAKMQLLEAAGVPQNDLYLLLVRDTGRQVDHAVLLVRDAGRLLVLDSAVDAIRSVDEVTAYRPVVSFSGQTRWLFRSALAEASPEDAAVPSAAPGVGPASAAPHERDAISEK